MDRFDAYKQYYPDKWAAISALRRDTGLGFEDANRIINDLFGMTDDDEIRKADAEHEAIYQAQEVQKEELKEKAGKRAKVGFGQGLYAAIKTLFTLGKITDRS